MCRTNDAKNFAPVKQSAQKCRFENYLLIWDIDIMRFSSVICIEKKLSHKESDDGFLSFNNPKFGMQTSGNWHELNSKVVYFGLKPFKN